MVVAEYRTVGTLIKVKWILRTPRASSTLAPSTTHGVTGSNPVHTAKILFRSKKVDYLQIERLTDGNRHLISMLSEKNRDAYAFKKLLK